MLAINGIVSGRNKIYGNVYDINNINGNVAKAENIYVKELIFKSRYELPANGDSNILYICTDENSIYRFDSQTNSYACIGKNSSVYTGTTEYWDSQSDLIGKAGFIYIYEDYSNINGIPVPNIKIGDGKAYLIDSPFVTASVEDMINTHIFDDAVHVSEEDRAAWGDKIRCYIAPDDPENIIFTQENE